MKNHNNITSLQTYKIVTFYPSIKRNFFCHHMIYFVNILDFNNQKYQTHGTVRDGSYNGKLSFPVNDFVPFVIDQQ